MAVVLAPAARGRAEGGDCHLVDPQGRALRYLRLSVTDRCNLRCRYCMGAAGLDWVPRAEILTWEELEQVVRVAVGLGVRKVRITGGEPFVRRGTIDFLARIRRLPGLERLVVTTNGVGLAGRVGRLAAIPVDGVNLSLDALDRDRFLQMSRRDRLADCLATLDALLAAGLTVKVNAVVVAGMNEAEIVPLAELARFLPIEVRFIEAMPFGGDGVRHTGWPASRILAHLRRHLPPLTELGATGTAMRYQAAGFRGQVGIIAGESRAFCTSCDRLRVTARGEVKSCLYGEASGWLLPRLRSGASDGELAELLRGAVAHRHADGRASEGARRNRLVVSMAAIGG